MATIYAFLLMGRPERERPLPWKELRAIGGVNYRAMEELFKIAEARKESVTYEFSVNVLEVYNEQIRDLLSTGSLVSVGMQDPQ